MAAGATVGLGSDATTHRHALAGSKAPWMKLLFFLKSEGNATDLRRWLIEKVGRALAADRRVSRFVVGRVQARTLVPHDPPSQRQTDAPSLDVTVEIEGLEFDYGPLIGDLASRTTAVHAFRVTPTVVWDREVRSAGEKPGTTYFALLRFHEDLPDSAARRSWAVHGELARHVHVGCTCYVQNWVDERLAGAGPRVQGVPQLTFPTEADLMGGSSPLRSAARMSCATAATSSRAGRGCMSQRWW